jgi:hypothetical protein
MKLTPAQQSLLEYLGKYADTNNLSHRELGRAVFDLYVKQPLMPKGGVGLIEGDCFIDLNAARNRLILPDKHEWLGDSAQKREVVYFRLEAGAVPQIQHSLDGLDLFLCVMVVFEPTRVTVVNFGDNSSGFYNRANR